MSNKSFDKKRYFAKRVCYWKEKLLIDPKILIKVDFKKIEDLEACSKEEHTMPEWLKQEELMVSTLERILLGPERFKKVLSAYAVAQRSTLGECDDNSGQYLRFTIYAYPAMLEVEGEQYKVLADSIACHEMCHVLLWPLTSYLSIVESTR